MRINFLLLTTQIYGSFYYAEDLVQQGIEYKLNRHRQVFVGRQETGRRGVVGFLIVTGGVAGREDDKLTKEDLEQRRRKGDWDRDGFSHHLVFF